MMPYQIRQAELQAAFVPSVTKKQAGVQARVAEHLKKHGRITAYEIQKEYETTDARKVCWRLKRLGVIGRVTEEPNAHGRGNHAVYWYNESKDNG